MAKGFGSSFTYNFDPHWGAEIDFGQNWGNSNYETTASVGPRFIWRTDSANYFLHTLISLNRVSVSGLNAQNGVGAIMGGGMDLPLKKWLAFRLFEADYVWAKHDYSDFVAPMPDDSLRHASFNGVRLRTGFVFNFGGEPAVTPTASCSVQPTEVMVGEPMTATVTASNFNPKHTLTYAWSSTGGHITGRDNTASVDTNGLAGGSYTVTAHISDPKMRRGGEASCSASFRVKEPPKNPPALSCSANPTTVQMGTSSTISCTCTSPDNVPVTVGDWTASSGSISGSGNTATLSTTGASAGPITVSATCTDSRGLKSPPATTQVMVENPPPSAPQASKLSQCDFPNPVKPWRVDNTCKAALDDVAKNLQQNADSKLVIVGNAEPTEKRKNLAAERAVNSKAYLTGGESKLGIDPSRIEVRTGSGGVKTAEYWTVPAGATFSGEGTQPVDETKVKAVPDHPAHPAAKQKVKAAQ